VVVRVVQAQTFQATVQLEQLHQQQSQALLVQTDLTLVETVVVEVPVVEVSTVELAPPVVETVLMVEFQHAQEHH
jgi:hypothetical protein